jgi:hypothetical protein
MKYKAACTRSAISLIAGVLSFTQAHAGECRRTIGGYQTIYAAEAAAQQARNAGYQTSGVWGQGGIISDWSNRRYYFNVFFPC